MQALWLPDSICDFIDKKIRNCIWAKGDQIRSWNLVCWDEISCPKINGGLGIRSARNNNLALLGKIVNDMLHGGDKLWVQVLSEKYLQKDIVLAENYKTGDSYIWRGIMKAKEKLKDGFGPHLGEGTSST